MSNVGSTCKNYFKRDVGRCVGGYGTVDTTPIRTPTHEAS